MTSPATDRVDREVEVVVVGGGQAALSVGYYLRRAGRVAADDYVLLDGASEPGGSWSQMWPSLRLFSPAAYSSLPGWPMPPWADGFPPADHVRSYLAAYEARYDLRVQRPVTVEAVHPGSGSARFEVVTNKGTWRTANVVSATGTWRRPFWPMYPGADTFAGTQIHTVHYAGPEPFRGQRVVVVGGGNSAAQILAEVSTVAATTWVTTTPPRFLPDEVDGRALFDAATARAKALAAGATDPGGVAALGDIVMVPPVFDARSRGVLHARPMFDRLDPAGIAWADGSRQDVDAVIWCTGFRPALNHLRTLALPLVDGHPRTDGTRCIDQPGLYLVGYGDWTGPATATLIGVGRSARTTVEHLSSEPTGT
jgi:thioredoxin reductase